MLARIHRRHAILERTRQEYVLHPVPGATTYWGGKLLRSAAPLRDGDTIALGMPENVWVFRRIARAPGSAVLDTEPAAAPAFYQRRAYRKLVFVEDAVPLDVVCDPRPVQRSVLAAVELRWRAGEMFLQSKQTWLTMHSLHGIEEGRELRVRTPSRVSVELADEAEWLGLTLSGAAADPTDVEFEALAVPREEGDFSP